MTGRAAGGMALLIALLQSGLAALQPPSFSSHALGVRVDVLVTDGRKPVVGLKASDFTLRDDGVQQTFELIDASDVPINVVLALDTSASTAGGRLAHLIAASGARAHQPVWRDVDHGRRLYGVDRDAGRNRPLTGRGLHRRVRRIQPGFSRRKSSRPRDGRT